MWLLGFELGTFARAVSALNHLSSPLPLFLEMLLAAMELEVAAPSLPHIVCVFVLVVLGEMPIQAGSSEEAKFRCILFPCR